MVDTWFISLTGNTDLVAGVSLCSPIFILSIAMGDIWGLGSSSLISRLLGQKKDADARRISAFTFFAAFGTGLVFMAALLVFRSPILRLLGAEGAALPHASSYYTYIALGTPFIVLTLIPNNQLRTEGLAAQGMWGTVIGSVANMALDPLFIFTFHMGSAGAALATSLSNVLSCAIYVYIIRKKCRVINVDPKQARIQRRELAGVLAIGIPASITNITSSLSIALTNRYLVPFGSQRVAAMGIASRINMLSLMTIIGFAFGGQPLFGYTYGAGNRDRFRKTVRFAYIFEAALGAMFAIVLYIAAPWLIRCFLEDAQVIDAGAEMLRFMQISSLLVGVTLVTTCICQAVGSAAGALILSLSRQGVLFFLAITLLTQWMGYKGILLSQPAADFLTGLIAVLILTRILKTQTAKHSSLEE